MIRLILFFAFTIALSTQGVAQLTSNNTGLLAMNTTEKQVSTTNYNGGGNNGGSLFGGTPYREGYPSHLVRRNHNLSKRFGISLSTIYNFGTSKNEMTEGELNRWDNVINQNVKHAIVVNYLVIPQMDVEVRGGTDGFYGGVNFRLMDFYSMQKFTPMIGTSMGYSNEEMEFKIPVGISFHCPSGFNSSLRFNGHMPFGENDPHLSAELTLGWRITNW